MAAIKGRDIWNRFLQWIEAQFSMIINENVQVETSKEDRSTSHIDSAFKLKPRRRDQGIQHGQRDEGSFKAQRPSKIIKRQDGRPIRARRGSRNEARHCAQFRRSRRLKRGVMPSHHACHPSGKGTLPLSCKTSSKQKESPKSCNKIRRSIRIAQLKATVDRPSI